MNSTVEIVISCVLTKGDHIQYRQVKIHFWLVWTKQKQTTEQHLILNNIKRVMCHSLPRAFPFYLLITLPFPPSLPVSVCICIIQLINWVETGVLDQGGATITTLDPVIKTFVNPQLFPLDLIRSKCLISQSASPASVFQTLPVNFCIPLILFSLSLQLCLFCFRSPSPATILASAALDLHPTQTIPGPLAELSSISSLSSLQLRLTPFKAV